MRVKEISDYREFASLKDEWNSLLKKSNTDSIFLRHEWFECWWRSHADNYEEDSQLFILLVHQDDGKTIAIFPFLHCQSTYRKVSVNKICYLQSGLTPYIDFILTGDKEKIIDKVLTHLFQHKKWDVFILNNFPTYTETYAILLAGLRLQKITFGSKPALNSPVVATTGDWDEFLAARPLKFRKSMRNKLNRIKKIPEISIEKYSDPQQVVSFALPHVFEIARNSWKAQEKHAFVDSKAYTSFYSMFTEIAASSGWINIWLLKYKDTYVAHEYHLKYNNKIYPIGADYDAEYQNLSPGSILEYNIIKSLFEDPEIEAYNTCAQDYKYLRNWTESFNQHVNIEIFSRNFIPSILYFIEYIFFPPLRNIRLLNSMKRILEKHGLWMTK